MHRANPEATKAIAKIWTAINQLQRELRDLLLHAHHRNAIHQDDGQTTLIHLADNEGSLEKIKENLRGAQSRVVFCESNKQYILLVHHKEILVHTGDRLGGAQRESEEHARNGAVLKLFDLPILVFSDFPQDMPEVLPDLTLFMHEKNMKFSQLTNYDQMHHVIQLMGNRDLIPARYFLESGSFEHVMDVFRHFEGHEAHAQTLSWSLGEHTFDAFIQHALVGSKNKNVMTEQEVCSLVPQSEKEPQAWIQALLVKARSEAPLNAFSEGEKRFLRRAHVMWIATCNMGSASVPRDWSTEHQISLAQACDQMSMGMAEYQSRYGAINQFQEQFCISLRHGQIAAWLTFGDNKHLLGVHGGLYPQDLEGHLDPRIPYQCCSLSLKEDVNQWNGSFQKEVDLYVKLVFSATSQAEDNLRKHLDPHAGMGLSFLVAALPNCSVITRSPSQTEGAHLYTPEQHSRLKRNDLMGLLSGHRPGGKYPVVIGWSGVCDDASTHSMILARPDITYTHDYAVAHQIVFDQAGLFVCHTTTHDRHSNALVASLHLMLTEEGSLQYFHDQELQQVYRGPVLIKNKEGVTLANVVGITPEGEAIFQVMEERPTCLPYQAMLAYLSGATQRQELAALQADPQVDLDLTQVAVVHEATEESTTPLMEKGASSIGHAEGPLCLTQAMHDAIQDKQNRRDALIEALRKKDDPYYQLDPNSTHHENAQVSGMSQIDTPQEQTPVLLLSHQGPHEESTQEAPLKRRHTML